MRLYFAILPAVFIVSLVFVVRMCLSAIMGGGDTTTAILLLLLMVPTGISAVYICFAAVKNGIYRSDGKIIYRRYKTTEIACSEIEVIAIVPKAYTIDVHTVRPCRKEKIDGHVVKTPLYAMILLRDSPMTPRDFWELERNSQVYEYRLEYRKSILGAALYNEELLNELLRRNPNIKVLASEQFR